MTHALGIKEITFKSFRSSGSVSWRLAILCFVIAFNRATLAPSGTSNTSRGFESPSNKHQRLRESCGDMVGKTGGKPYRTRGGRRLEFEIGKDLLDWNSLIAIGASNSHASRHTHK